MFKPTKKELINALFLFAFIAILGAAIGTYAKRMDIENSKKEAAAKVVIDAPKAVAARVPVPADPPAVPSETAAFDNGSIASGPDAEGRWPIRALGNNWFSRDVMDLITHKKTTNVYWINERLGQAVTFRQSDQRVYLRFSKSIAADLYGNAQVDVRVEKASGAVVFSFYAMQANRDNVLILSEEDSAKLSSAMKDETTAIFRANTDEGPEYIGVSKMPWSKS